MITQEQREQRVSHIGSSDAPVIAGVDSWRNLADLWLEKTGRLVKREGHGENKNKASEAGTFLERAILDWAEYRLGGGIHRNQFLIHPDGIRAANLDGLHVSAFGASEIVEAKSHGIMSGFVNDDEWGEPETDEVPARIRVQCQHQIDVASAVLGTQVRRVWVPALLVRVGFAMFYVDHSDDLSHELEEAELDFWNSHVLADVLPPDEPPSLSTLRRMRREPSKVIPLEPKFINDWTAAKAVAKAADEQSEEALARLLARLDDAEGAEVWGFDDETEQPKLLGTFTYLEQSRDSYQVDACTYRVPRWKAVKEKKLRRRS